MKYHTSHEHRAAPVTCRSSESAAKSAHEVARQSFVAVHTTESSAGTMYRLCIYGGVRVVISKDGSARILLCYSPLLRSRQGGIPGLHGFPLDQGRFLLFPIAAIKGGGMLFPLAAMLFPLVCL